MTRKDYIAIAEALTDSQLSNARSLEEAQHWHAQWSTCVVTIADVLAADNPRFDRQRFYAATFDQQRFSAATEKRLD